MKNKMKSFIAVMILCCTAAGTETIAASSLAGNAPPEARYFIERVDYPANWQQDQPSSGLRARVQSVVGRLRQLRATIRGIRFRRTGPFRWECEIAYKLPGGMELVCRIKADGTVEGI